MRQSEDDEIIGRLDSATLALVRICGTADTVATDIEGWLIEAGIDPGDEHQRTSVALKLKRRPFYGRGHGHTAAYVALLHLLPDASSDVVRMLEVIGQEFEADLGLLAYLKGRATDALTQAALAAAVRGGDALEQLLRHRRCEIDGTDLVIEPGGKVPLANALSSFMGHPLLLWKFQNCLRGGKDAFDIAVARRQVEFREDVSKGLLGLFENGADPSPSEFLGGLVSIPEDDGILGAVLDELSYRMRTRDGFRHGPSAAKWLEAVAGMRNWSPDRLRTLLAFSDGTPQEAKAELAAAVRSSVAKLAEADPAAAAYGALSLMRFVRLAREDTRLMGHADLEAECLWFVAGLPQGGELVAAWKLWEAVPLRPGRQEAAWAWLSDQVKQHWASRLSATVADAPSVAAGVVEFILSWAPKEVAADLECVVIELVQNFELENLLKHLAAKDSNVCALRAGALFDYLILGKPP